MPQTIVELAGLRPNTEISQVLNIFLVHIGRGASTCLRSRWASASAVPSESIAKPLTASRKRRDIAKLSTPKPRARCMQCSVRHQSVASSLRDGSTHAPASTSHSAFCRLELSELDDVEQHRQNRALRDLPRKSGGLLVYCVARRGRRQVLRSVITKNFTSPYASWRLASRPTFFLHPSPFVLAGTILTLSTFLFPNVFLGTPVEARGGLFRLQGTEGRGELTLPAPPARCPAWPHHSACIETKSPRRGAWKSSPCVDVAAT